MAVSGYRPHTPWLRLPVIDRSGRIRQHRGATAVPGLYTVGLPFQHRRDAGYIGGARHDVEDVLTHLASTATPAHATGLAA